RKKQLHVVVKKVLKQKKLHQLLKLKVQKKHNLFDYIVKSLPIWEAFFVIENFIFLDDN
ncbi:MAG TPA: hypothetical protein DCF99_14405, partial [Flavobacteriaceae bacterium]|nr:hypothetical protein [Flavobacteriaceae bacterium]